jgi:SAM-dependent methyltransferase
MSPKLSIVKSTIMSLKQQIVYALYYLLPHRPPWDTGISPPELMNFIHSHPPGRALDLGCGTGTNVITLAQHGWQVTGVDFVHRAVRQARHKAKKAGVQVDLRVGDVSQPKNIQGLFDLILDIGCFHSLSAAERERYIHNLELLLARDGTFLSYVFFRHPAEKGAGLVEDDVKTLSKRLLLVKRQDGSERGIRPSAWLTFRKRQG